MSSICGVASAAAATDIRAMLDVLDHWHADERGEWAQDDVALGSLRLATTPEAAHEHQPIHDDAARLTVTGDLRFDNRAELCAALGIPIDDATHWPDSRLLLRAYQKWGDDCLDHVRGDFSFAIWDARQRKLFCARDRFGVKPFYYYHGPGGFAFATEIKGLLALDFVDREVNEAWIGDYLHRIMVDGVSTFYAHINRLEPAHKLVRTDAGVTVTRYWSPDAKREIKLANDNEYFEGFRERLVTAVGRRLRTNGVIGAELSGGLDSSAICSIAQDLLRRDGRALHTFSQVRPTATNDPSLPADSRGAIEQLIEHAGITEASFLTGEDAGIVSTLDWSERYIDEPPRVVVGLYNDLLYETARQKGVRVLLSGYGGNQGVSAPSASARPIHVFIKSLINKVAPANGGGKLWKKYAYRPLRDDVADRIRMLERAKAYEKLYTRRGNVRAVTAYSLTTPNVALRLEWGHLCASTRRMEYRYPLLDQDLAEFYLAIPARLKHANGFGRYVFRSSITPYVPDEIRWATGGRTSANPGVVARKRRDRTELVQRITSLDRSNPVFDYVDLDKLLAKPELLGQNGRTWDRDTELISVLILEQKLQQAKSRA